MNELKRLIASVTYQLYANALLRCLLLAVTVYLLTATFLGQSGWAFVLSAAGFGAGVFLSRLYQDKKPQAVRLIHQHVGDAEYSLPLLTKPNLNLAEQLQLDRLNQQIQHVPTPVVIWSKVGLYSLCLLAALTVYVGYPLIAKTPKNDPKKKGFLAAIMPDNKPEAPTFEKATLRIQPPAYTRLPATNSTNLNAASVVGSSLTWQVQFSDTRNLTVKLVGSRGQAIPFKNTGDGFTHQDRLINSGLYAIKAYWRTENNRDSLIYQSDFYRLEARPDLAPENRTDLERTVHLPLPERPKNADRFGQNLRRFQRVAGLYRCHRSAGLGRKRQVSGDEIPAGAGQF